MAARRTCACVRTRTSVLVRLSSVQGGNSYVLQALQHTDWSGDYPVSGPVSIQCCFVISTHRNWWGTARTVSKLSSHCAATSESDQFFQQLPVWILQWFWLPLVVSLSVPTNKSVFEWQQSQFKIMKVPMLIKPLGHHNSNNNSSEKNCQNMTEKPPAFGVRHKDR